MGKVNIKLRRKILTPDSLEQYRDYPALLKKYERTRRYKQAIKIFIYSLIVTAIVLLLLFISFSMLKVMKNKKELKSNLEQPVVIKHHQVSESAEI